MPYTVLATEFIDFTENLRIVTYCGVEIARNAEGDIRPVMEAIRQHAMANGVSLPNETDYQMITHNVRGVALALVERRTWRELGSV